jgi:hypothetical protein
LIGIDPSICPESRAALAQHAVDACPADAEPARDRRRDELFLESQPSHLDGVDRWLAALVDAARLAALIASN